MLERFDLPSAGVDYVRYILERERGLAAIIMQADLESGRTFSPLPAGTSLERACRFKAGGLLGFREASGWYADHARDLLGDAVGTLIIQDVWMKPRDKKGRRPEVSTLFCDDEVYYV